MPSGKSIPLSPMRRAIAANMLKSKQTIPHAWTVAEVDMTNVVRFRQQAKDAFKQREGIDLTFAPNEVTAMIGPSGCGKSTVVRCINRMHEEIPGARIEGRILLDDQDVHAKDIDVMSVRRKGARMHRADLTAASGYHHFHS